MATTESLSLPLLAQEFVTEVSQKHNQKVKVLRKSESWLMRAIGFILKPFNPTFMEQYITTIGATIYIPDDFLTSFGEMEVLDVLAHETQHVIDFTKNRLLFVLGYLFPQCLALLALLSIFAFLSPWMLLCLLFLLFLAPIPAPFRYKFEVSGYRTTILFARKVYHYTDEQMAQLYQWVSSQMTTGNYYFAFPFPGKIAKDLKDESFMLEPRYVEIIDFLKRHGKIQPS